MDGSIRGGTVSSRGDSAIQRPDPTAGALASGVSRVRVTPVQPEKRENEVAFPVKSAD